MVRVQIQALCVPNYLLLTSLTGFSTGSDPRAGTPPSVLTNTAILTSISLYYLTQSFLSAVWIYAQNPTPFQTVYTKAVTDAPLLFTQFEYNVGFWPKEYVAKLGNLVSYKGMHHVVGVVLTQTDEDASA